jgi:hypothetical protein
MRSKWIAAGVSVLAMALPATAMAGTQGGPPGGGAGGVAQAQQSGQWAATLQGAESQAQAAQNAVNTNAPSNTAGNDINGAGGNNATQNATNVGASAALNLSKTKQDSSQTQSADPSGGAGLGGTGQAQDSSQLAATLQGAASRAKADQNAVNANTPSNTAGHDINGGGGDNATQNATNGAASLAANGSKTDQSSTQSQDAGQSPPWSGTGSKSSGGDQKGSGYGSSGQGGTGQFQGNSQWAATLQGAQSDAKAKQNAVNANTPSNTAGHDINGAGGDNATQNATNVGLSGAFNGSKTKQSNNQYQDPTSGQSSGGDPKGSGYGSFGQGGTGQFQGNSQWAATLQGAQSDAKAKQNAVNTNAPSNTAGHDINGAGGDNATQNATNVGLSGAFNGSKTDQSNSQTQSDSSSCVVACGGAGQAQFNDQGALTGQYADSSAKADQNTVNANVPVNIAGHDINGAGGDNATQNTTNGAGSLAGNLSGTDQSNSQSQTAGSSCLVACGGAGQLQSNSQNAVTGQYASSSADANQNTVNANVPVNIAGHDINGAGGDNATQNATNLAGSAALNGSSTDQSNSQTQTAGSSCFVACGGAGQAQFSSQGALTGQYATSSADASQNAVNANVPVNIAGHDINGAGGDNATQNATNAGGSLAGNLSGTGQDGGQQQIA